VNVAEQTKREEWNDTLPRVLDDLALLGFGISDHLDAVPPGQRARYVVVDTAAVTEETLEDVDATGDGADRADVVLCRRGVRASHTVRDLGGHGHSDSCTRCRLGDRPKMSLPRNAAA